jgi:hypothetical protein
LVFKLNVPIKNAALAFGLRDWITLGLVTAFSLSFALFLIGVIRLDPTSTLWLNDGDVAQHYLGWHFFRGEPWSLPLGRNLRYGLDMGSSIVFTDSIPLLALTFKAARAILPQHFQYAGFWMACCIVAQGIAAFFLLRRFTKNHIVLLCGAALFVLSPVLVSRTMGHFALVGQWTVLLALCLYFSPVQLSSQRWSWRALLITTSLIHGYLLYFVIAIWCVALLRDIETQKGNRAARFASTAVTLVLLAFSLWLAGWFEVPFGSAAFGSTYGQYAANLNAFVNPLWGSPILPSLKNTATTSGVESINYLGAGVLALVVAAAALSARASTIRWVWHEHHWLLLATVSLSLFAFGTTLYWGDTLIATLPLPEDFTNKLEFIRASGRLLWLAHYLVILIVIVVATTRLPRHVTSATIVAALALQIYDLKSSYSSYAEHLSRSAKEAVVKSETASLKSPFWAVAATRYSEIDFFPITHSPPRYEPIALWAGDHHIAINAAYFGRISPERAFARTPELVQELTSGKRRSSTIYIVQNREDIARLVLQPNDGAGDIDGYFLVVPGWFAIAPMNEAVRNLLQSPSARSSALLAL